MDHRTDQPERTVWISEDPNQDFGAGPQAPECAQCGKQLATLTTDPVSVFVQFWFTELETCVCGPCMAEEQQRELAWERKTLNE